MASRNIVHLHKKHSTLCRFLPSYSSCYLEYGCHVARLRRCRRAYAPTSMRACSNTASHDNHEKLLFPIYGLLMGLRLAALRAAGAPLIWGKCSTAGHGVFTISCLEVRGELQSCKYQYTGCRAPKNPHYGGNS